MPMMSQPGESPKVIIRAFKEVGIRGRRTVAIVVNSVGHGELEQTIRVAVGIGGSLKLLLKSLEVGILRVLLIITSYI